MNIIEMARKSLSRFCHGKQTLCVPAQESDDDIVINAALDYAERTERNFFICKDAIDMAIQHSSAGTAGYARMRKVLMGVAARLEEK